MAKKVKNRKEKELRRGKHFYANDNDFSVLNNTFPEEYIDTIVCADSRELLKKLPDNCVDLIFTSPPYNFGLDYESDDNEDSVDWGNYFDTLFSILDECIRVLKFSGRLVINIQPNWTDSVPTHHIISNYLMAKKLIWKGEVLWEKNNYNCNYTAWGSWKSPSSPYLKYTWEFVEIFCKGALKKEGDSNNIDLLADDFKDWTTAKWSIAPERSMRKYKHPAMFPEELAKRIIQLFSYKNDVILDPFNGAGTTTYIAKIFKRRYLGIDISKEYCEEAKDRIFNCLF
jgi:DNA modification methylase